MRRVWVAVVLLASACGRPAEEEAASPCDGEFASGEFGSNYAVLAALSHPPAVGDTATLTMGVCAREAARSTVSVRLRGGLAWRTPPDGTVVTRAPAPYGGCEETAAGEWDLLAMTPLRLTGTVVATAAGTAELTGSAVPAVAGSGAGNDAAVYLTVGADAASSHFGYPERDGPEPATTATPLPGC
jgi:hypothetical protein